MRSTHCNTTGLTSHSNSQTWWLNELKMSRLDSLLDIFSLGVEHNLCLPDLLGHR